jgi:hypothetical protein
MVIVNIKHNDDELERSFKKTYDQGLKEAV